MKDNMEQNNLQENVNVKPKKKSKVKVIIIVIIAAVVVLGLAYFIGNGIKKMSDSMQETMNSMMGSNEDTYTVEKQNVKQEITTSGNVIGIDAKAYTSPVTAKVTELCVEPGQTVKKGDVLLKYDTSELGDNLEKVRIQAQSEKAAGSETYEAVSEAAAKVSEAKKKKKSLTSDIKKLKKEVSDLSDKVAAFEEKIKNQEEIDEAAYKKATSNLEKKSASLASKQEKLAEQEGIIAANEEVKVSSSAQAQINASNKLADMSVNDAEKTYSVAEAGLTADVSGIVQTVDVVEGAYANETQTVMTIIDENKIGVEFSISKDDLGSISKGQKARVVISSNEYEGTVEYISRVATTDMASQSSTATIKGRIVLDKPDENIYIGVSAKVYIFVGESDDAIAIPYEALNTDVEGDFVYVVNKEGLIERKDVSLGIYSDEYYEILEGLAEGDKVITKVTSDMKPGDVYVGSAAAGTVAVE